MPQPKTAAKGHGLRRKVLGLPVWAWGAVIVGGVLMGVYLRRKSASAASTTADTSTTDTSAGAGATPSDNGLGSSSMDLQGFLDAQGQLLDQFGTGLQGLLTSSQAGANFGDGGFTDSGGGSFGGDSTGTVATGTISLGPYNQGGDLNLSSLSPAALKAAWADYAAAQRKQGITAPKAIPYSRPGTTVKVPGGAFTQVSKAPAAAAKKVRAIFVPKHGSERAHWALPSGRWVSGPGLY
jgi:hypothetical protein